MEQVFKKAEISEGVNVDGENLSNLRFADDVALLNETTKQMEKHPNNTWTLYVISITWKSKRQKHTTFLW